MDDQAGWNFYGCVDPSAGDAGNPIHILKCGLPVPKFIDQGVLDQLRDLQLYPDDVWVVTYPKCGTTWSQQIMRLIRNKGVLDDRKVDFAVPWSEGIERLHFKAANFSFDKVKRPRDFSSHLPYDLIPFGPPYDTPCRYIYVARNPKDVAVSCFFHNKVRYFPNLEWDAFWKMYIEGRVEFGKYIDHLLSWLPHKDDENVLFLTYESMKKDLKQAVSKMATFMGENLSDDIIAKIADMTTFENMKKDNTANYSWQVMFQKEGVQPFLRKGIVGDWKNFLTAEQSMQIDAIYAEKLKGTGFAFEYE